MDVRQKTRDLLLNLQQDRKTQVIAFCIVLAIIFMMFGGDNGRRGPAGPQEPVALNTGASDKNEPYTDLITRFSKDLEVISTQVTEIESNNRALRTSIEESEARSAEIFKKLIERMADLESSQGAQGDGGIGPIDVPGEDIGDLPDQKLVSFGDIEEAEVAPPLQPEIERIALIGAGDSVRVKLLAGVNAPTDGTPYPVVFKLVDDVSGPDGSALPLGEARVIAAAQGSLSDQRALFRLTTLNVRYPDGSRNVLDIDGWIVGEDGIRGMEGILIDPIGKALFGSLLSGTVKGIGEGIAFSNVFTGVNTNGSAFSYVDGNIAEYAVGKGLSSAGDRWADFIDERMRLLVPHVKVLSGRVGTAVFSRSVRIDGLYDALRDQEYAFTGLD